MRQTVFLLAVTLAWLPLQASAAGPVPEIRRDVGTPQATGAAHTLRTIPEACARFEGRFTGNAAAPYDFAAVPTSPQCQPRARLVPFEQAGASVEAGWLLNDLIRVPSADCATQHAVVRVWRKPADNTPTLDGQGSARVYLQDATQAAAAREPLPAVSLYTAQMTLQGTACR
jgi:hypothetical protein